MGKGLEHTLYKVRYADEKQACERCSALLLLGKCLSKPQ